MYVTHATAVNQHAVHWTRDGQYDITFINTTNTDTNTYST